VLRRITGLQGAAAGRAAPESRKEVGAGLSAGVQAVGPGRASPESTQAQGWRQPRASDSRGGWRA
jgi:hypothetical protein